MKLFIWRFRYALRMSTKGYISFFYGWRGSLDCIDNIGDDWKEDSPIYCADEDMANWSD